MKFPEALRVTGLIGSPWNSQPGDPFGAFQVSPLLNPRRRTLNIIVSDGREEDGTASTGWEHVSVSIMGQLRTTPTWEEMCLVKHLFWSEEEWVVQFHPAKAANISYHHGTLHLWRPFAAALPTPPPLCV